MNKAELESERIAMLVAEMSKKYDKCILCGNLTKNRGVFFPNKTGQLGANDKKYRVVIFSLCWRHEQNEETAAKVEEYLYKNQNNMNNVTKDVLGDIQ